MRSTVQRVEVLEAWAFGAIYTKPGLVARLFCYGSHTATLHTECCAGRTLRAGKRYAGGGGSRIAHERGWLLFQVSRLRGKRLNQPPAPYNAALAFGAADERCAKALIVPIGEES